MDKFSIRVHQTKDHFITFPPIYILYGIIFAFLFFHIEIVFTIPGQKYGITLMSKHEYFLLNRAFKEYTMLKKWFL